jgi:hypothetical protein
MLNYIGGIEVFTSRTPEQVNNHRIEKHYPLSPGNVSLKKAKRKSGFKKGFPVCNWTMPAQPEGYIWAGKYDLL